LRLFTTLAPTLADLLLFLGYAVKGGPNLEDLTSFFFTTLFIRVLLGVCASVFSVVDVVGAGFPAGVAASEVAAAGVVVVGVATGGGDLTSFLFTTLFIRVLLGACAFVF